MPKSAKPRKIKILKRNPVAKAMGELGYIAKVVPSKKKYKRVKKKQVMKENAPAEES